MRTLLIFLLLGLFCFSCQFQSNQNSVLSSSLSKKVQGNDKAIEDGKLSKYWYEGKAELSKFTLQQNRYQDINPGYELMIFVTEDFLTDNQVKNDNYTNPNSIPILKHNRIRHFSTGIYDYSMMTSTFTPADRSKNPHSLKVTSTAQEWCGHSFLQLNKTKKGYKSKLFSYFESEGDRENDYKHAVLEDEIMNLIRINPKYLPMGNISIIPSAVISRLMHLDAQVLEAKAQSETYQGQEFEGKNLMQYQLGFPSLKRTLQIVYSADSPYKISGWKDSYPSLFDKKIRTTLAKKTHERRSAYWKENGLADMQLRKELGLSNPE